MTYTRKDAWNLGAGWNDTFRLYAKAVGVLQQRPTTDNTSWAYLAAIHGFDLTRWHDLGLIDPTDPGPPPNDPVSRQCQHMTWYFLPWHRGYLLAFEAIVRDAIATFDPAGAKNWALPYWNYSDLNRPETLGLPYAFTQKSQEDGSHNPLFVEQRWGPRGGKLPTRDVALTSLQDSDFTNSTSIHHGFGGPKTGFWHGDRGGHPFGGLESLPHNPIHVDVGGSSPDGLTDGVMSDPDTAGYDPIFWLHHANIDRLWEVWLRQSNQHQNPSQRAWLAGPSPRDFAMPQPGGSVSHFKPSDMLSLQVLGYTYEDMTPPFAATRAAVRSVRLSLSGGQQNVVQPKPSVLVGASQTGLALGPTTVATDVALDRSEHANIVKSFARSLAAEAAPAEPDRVYLSIENVTAKTNAANFNVYVSEPNDPEPQSHEENLAGVLSLFGARKASLRDGDHAGNGVNTVMEITDIVDGMHLKNAFDIASLKVTFVPATAIPKNHEIKVGRVSIYRQGH